MNQNPPSNSSDETEESERGREREIEKINLKMYIKTTDEHFKENLMCEEQQ